MPIKVAINGFGRIGRLALRAALYKAQSAGCCGAAKLPKIVAINDPGMKVEHIAYLLKYDSTHGIFCGEICTQGSCLMVDGQQIQTFAEKDPTKIAWKEIDYVLESSGQFKTKESASLHLKGCAKRVLVSAPSNDLPMFVMGVNHDCYDPNEHKVVSMASCTTNCLAPLCKVIHENFCIKEALMSTVHAVTISQKTIDGVKQKKMRSARGCMQNIIPATTGAAKALGKIIPELEGKITGMAFRVPIPDGSLVDLTCRLNKDADLKDINCAIKEASEGSLKGILGYTEEDIVSSDIIGDTRSSIFDAKACLALNKKFVKLIAWYDNEYGYATRIYDFLTYMAKKECPKESKECCP